MTAEALHILEILLQHPEGITRDEVNQQLIDDGAEPVERKPFAKADENDAHYIRTLPLHYTQKETEPGVFTLEMCVTKDFELYMRRYENTTWEVEEEKSEE